MFQIISLRPGLHCHCRFETFDLKTHPTNTGATAYYGQRSWASRYRLHKCVSLPAQLLMMRSAMECGVHPRSTSPLYPADLQCLPLLLPPHHHRACWSLIVFCTSVPTNIFQNVQRSVCVCAEEAKRLISFCKQPYTLATLSLPKTPTRTDSRTRARTRLHRHTHTVQFLAICRYLDDFTSVGIKQIFVVISSGRAESQIL